MKEIKSTNKYTFKVETWESSKGELGMMGWALYVAIPELEQWYKLEGSHRYYPLHPDNAENQAKMFLGFAMQGFYDERIRDDIYGDGVKLRGVHEQDTGSVYMWNEFPKHSPRCDSRRIPTDNDTADDESDAT